MAFQRGYKASIFESVVFVVHFWQTKKPFTTIVASPTLDKTIFAKPLVHPSQKFMNYTYQRPPVSCKRHNPTFHGADRPTCIALGCQGSEVELSSIPEASCSPKAQLSGRGAASNHSQHFERSVATLDLCVVALPGPPYSICFATMLHAPETTKCVGRVLYVPNRSHALNAQAEAEKMHLDATQTSTHLP